ncbi:MAG: putative thiosulfate sulfurtransferase SseA [Candidatus Heimdallarchaeota archaeon LC_2]|nr:MAG: putative thiosulfate sulfurtransferase SseA [Candidatus Heimdallarchaeota archaeon LC_2]
MSESTESYNIQDILTSTEWVADNLQLLSSDSPNPEYRLVESNEDPLLYRSGHISGAIEIDWTEDLNDPLTRDYINKDAFQELLRRKGIANNTTVIFYGDKNNWWSAYALWVFQLFGHTKVKLMNGGRIKWDLEKRELVKEAPNYPSTDFSANDRNDEPVRVFRDEVLELVAANGPFVDVRSPEEFSGERLHIPGYPNEGALRGGHIPGAKSIPWSTAVNEDGTFKNIENLKEIYFTKNEIDPDNDLIVYCRIGERSAHSWFVLKYLLGHTRVWNYDGSWTEYGNLVGVPIEK